MPLPPLVSTGSPIAATGFQSLATNIQAEMTRRGPFRIIIVGQSVTALNGTYTMTNASYSPATLVTTVTLSAPAPVYGTAIAAYVYFSAVSGGAMGAVFCTIRSAGNTFVIVGDVTSYPIINVVANGANLASITTGRVISANEINVYRKAILALDTFSLNHAPVQTLAATIPTVSAPITATMFNAMVNALADITGQPLVFTYNVTISVNTPGYNMHNAAVSAGWDMLTPLNMTVTINPGVYVFGGGTFGSPGTGTLPYAFETGSPFPNNTQLAIINNGNITGYGGNGGNVRFNWQFTGGTNGGSALHVQYPITITNNGTIAGGGGGGQGALISWYGNIGCSGAGGGAGEPPGVHGIGSGGNINSSGGDGTATTGGAGSNAAITVGGAGGNLGLGGGGGWTVYYPTGLIGSVGSAGNSVTGNAFITWAVLGTRLGPIA